ALGAFALVVAGDHERDGGVPVGYDVFSSVATPRGLSGDVRVPVASAVGVSRPRSSASMGVAGTGGLLAEMAMAVDQRAAFALAGRFDFAFPRGGGGGFGVCFGCYGCECGDC